MALPWVGRSLNLPKPIGRVRTRGRGRMRLVLAVSVRDVATT
jgi:hypothetical protein